MRALLAISLTALVAACSPPYREEPTEVWGPDGASDAQDGTWLGLRSRSAVRTPRVSLVTWPELDEVTSSVVQEGSSGHEATLRIRPSEALEPRWYAILVDRTGEPDRFWVMGGVAVGPAFQAYRVFGTSAPRIRSVSALSRLDGTGVALSQLTIRFSERVIVPEGVAIPITVASQAGPCTWFGQGTAFGPMDDLAFGCDVDTIESARVEVLERLIAEGGGTLEPVVLDDALTFVDEIPDGSGSSDGI